MRGHRYRKTVSVICLALSILFVITMSAGCGSKEAEAIDPATQAASISDEVVAEIVADFEKQLEAVDPSNEAYQALIDKIDFVSELLAQFNENLTTELDAVKTKVETAKTEFEEAEEEAAAETPNGGDTTPPANNAPSSGVSAHPGWKSFIQPFKNTTLGGGYVEYKDSTIYYHVGDYPDGAPNDTAEFYVNRYKNGPTPDRALTSLGYKNVANYMSPADLAKDYVFLLWYPSKSDAEYSKFFNEVKTVKVE